MWPCLLAVNLISQARPACTGTQAFVVRAEMPGTPWTPAANMALEISYCEADCSHPRAIASIANDSGRVVLMLPGACPGDMVSVSVKKPFGILYPPARRLPLSHDPDGAPLVVCEIGKCSLTQEAGERLRRDLLEEVRKVGAQDRERLIAEMQGRLDELRVDNQDLVAFVAKKERQLAAARQASRLLSAFQNRAQEVSDRFARYADSVTLYPGQPPILAIPNPATPESGRAGPAQQINEAIRAYNPVFDELRGNADDYAKGMLGYWSNEASNEFKRLVDAALAIHQQIHRFNAVKDDINKLNTKLVPKSQVQEVRKGVAEQTRAIASAVDQGLKEFQEDSGRFLASVESEFLEDGPTPRRDVPGR